MVDDSHAVGFVGPTGRGTPQICGVADRVDILTGTLGKARGGASGGFTASRTEVVDWLRQRSRPYLFSNRLATMIPATSLAVLDLLETDGATLHHRLSENAPIFRTEMTAHGFTLLSGEQPIIPIMLVDPQLAQEMAARLNYEGVFVTAFSYPVVPRGRDRIHTQMSAAHDEATLRRGIEALARVGRAMGVI